jgi:uncharacterized repeat protein (TIGR03803 family)
MRYLSIGALVLGVLGQPLWAAADYNVLHNFAGQTTDGGTPQSMMIVAGGLIYGTTQYGRSVSTGYNCGTAYTMALDGSGYKVLHNFGASGGTSSDGSYPLAPLVLSGNTLYGTAQLGGANRNGVVYSMSADGTTFTPLHALADGEGYACNFGQLVLSGNMLYGMMPSTNRMGDSGNGTLYKCNATTGALSVLHTFTGAVTDGANPDDGVVVDGTTIYGLTQFGGSAGQGAIFKVNTNGSGFTVMHSFTTDNSDGRQPFGGLVLDNGELYGTTRYGGANGGGTIFKIGTDGSYASIYSLPTASANAPMHGTVAVSGSALYAMTPYGGTSGNGTIFQIDTDGNNYALLHSFTGADGQTPQGGMFLANGVLYGTTPYGGTFGNGVAFSLSVPEPASLGLLAMAVWPLIARRRARA